MKIISPVFTLVLSIVLSSCGGGSSKDGSLLSKLFADTTFVSTQATFAGVRNDYTVTSSGTTYTVVDHFGTTGSTTIANATRLIFLDVTINTLTAVSAAKISAANLTTLIELYVAFFNRVPDADGLNYWINQFSAGQSLKSIADSFYGAGIANAATTGYTANMTNADFINIVYKNVLGRADGADADGLNYWTGKLLDGTATRGSLVIDILASAHTYKGDKTYGYVADLLDNKSTVSKSVAVDAGINFNTDPITKGILVAAAITSTDMNAARSVIGLNDLGFSASSIPAMNSVATRAVATFPSEIVIPTTSSATIPPVPANVTVAPSGANLKLWIYDPRSPNAAVVKPSIFYVTAGSSVWKFTTGSADGTLFLTLAAGAYQFDTVEPNSQTSLFSRHRYFVTVSNSGAVSMDGLTADSNGFFAVTVDLVTTVPAAVQQLRDKLTALAKEPASTFKPTSECQLIDQITPNRSLSTDLSAGFPKVRTRLPSYGRIRTLIIPVDFSDQAGIDNPVTAFTPIANNFRDFYAKQSYGRVAFDVDILPTWVRLPFLSTKYNMGSNVGAGDASGYRKAIFDSISPLIDLSQYDAVYPLVPKETPMSSIGWGPAITYPIFTTTGYVTNGASGGADMYLNTNNGIIGGDWKWMVHETGHAFGLYDEDLNHASQTLGYWSVMAMSWTNNAIEHNGWDRYLQGWLADAQVACLPKKTISAAGTTIKISPLVRQNAATKVIMVTLSTSKMLVMESRKNEGYDNIKASNEGVLVYTVDMTIGQLGGGYNTQRRIGSTSATFEDAALHAGDAIVVDGVTVSVVATSSAGDTVKISVK